ncbi:hypothetical protein [Neobacillus mesonae]|uniref:hypothetical protein n=1 Tax=Neobacillus mesonae TaxID=1193713 RepID=UPI000834D558|nr:hypothetical protein [Neobacillus mesonae]
MKAIEKVQQFLTEYDTKVNKLNERIDSCSTRIEELQLEIRFIKEKELPEASIQRVIDGNTALEAKLKKNLAKLEAELIEKQEEAVILNQALNRYKFQAAKELKQYQQIFNDERAIDSNKVYSKMMAAKREYVETMKAEAEVLHKYKEIDVLMQGIEVAAGIKSTVYNIFEVDSAPIIGHLNRHNSVYLALTHEEVQKIIKKQAIDLSYLDKFKHPKGL